MPLKEDTNNSLILKDRIAVVTGASSGIGQAIAKHLASNGARVIANARNHEALKELEMAFNKESVKISAVAGDAAEQSVIDAMLDQAKSVFGSEVDTVIVNAGRGLGGSITSSNINEWEEMVRINILGCFRLMRSGAERLLSQVQQHGSLSKSLDIVVMGSNVGRHISPFSSVYGATKFGVNSAAEALRRELGPKGIRVTLIEPGIVETGFQAVAGYDKKWFDEFAGKFGPVLQGDDVARVVTFVLSQPPHVHINDVVIRPTRQDYP